jgi:type IV pilus assembly protein PilM
LLTIDVGSRNIKILVGSVSGKSIRMQNQILLDTPENAVLNGLVVDPDAVAAALKGVLEQNRIRDKKATVVITSTDIVIREIKLPKTGKKNIDMIVANEMESFLGEDDYSVEYFMQDQEDGALRSFAFALPSQVVETYKKMLLSAGLMPAALDIASNCVRKLVTKWNLLATDGDPRLDILVDIGYSFINFNIFEKKNLLYSRCVKIDADEEVKKHVDSLRNKPRSELEQDIEFAGYLSVIGDEIQKIIQFLISSDFRMDDLKVFMCGGCANFDEVTYLLGEYMNMDISLIESRRSQIFKEERLKEFLNALGAQIRL